LAKEVLRQHSIQAVEWLLPAVFSSVYSENWEQKAEEKSLKT
jgi:hypothetical protein